MVRPPVSAYCYPLSFFVIGNVDPTAVFESIKTVMAFDIQVESPLKKH